MEPIVNVVLPVFAIIFAGFLAGQSGLLGEASSEALNRFVYWVALPVLLFYSMARVSPAEIFNGPFLAAFGLASLATMAGAFVIARYVFKGGLPENALFAMTSVFGNTGFMGIPLTLVAFGEPGTLPAIVATVFQTAILVALTAALIELGRAEGGQRGNVAWVLRSLAKNPLLISPIAGIAVSFTGLRLPDPVANFCDILAPAAGPCALFAIGLFLVGKPLRRGLGEVAVMTVLKLVVQPLVTWWLAFHVFEVEPLWATVAVLVAALPAGANCFVLAQAYGVYVQRTSAAILISTVAAVATVSVLFALPVMQP